MRGEGFRLLTGGVFTPPRMGVNISLLDADLCQDHGLKFLGTVALAQYLLRKESFTFEISRDTKGHDASRDKIGVRDTQKMPNSYISVNLTSETFQHLRMTFIIIILTYNNTRLLSVTNY